MRIYACMQCICIFVRACDVIFVDEIVGLFCNILLRGGIFKQILIVYLCFILRSKIIYLLITCVQFNQFENFTNNPLLLNRTIILYSLCNSDYQFFC